MLKSTSWQRARALLMTQTAIALCLYAMALRALMWSTGYHGDEFTRIAYDDFLLTIIGYQLRVLPAYAVLVVAYTTLTLPILNRSAALERVACKAGRWRRLKLFGWTLLTDSVVGLLSIGLFYQYNPGLLDGTARRLSVVAPDVDLYVLYRWRIFDGLAVGFGLLGLWALVWYGRRWWANIRMGSIQRRLMLTVPVGLVVGMLFGVLQPPAPPPMAADTPLNVLIIATDSLRYDRLGVHGHDRDVSPNIDAFAREAVDFEQLHVATASTLESWISMMSSQFPPNHGVRYMYLRREQAEAAGHVPNLLPRVLNDMGYHTSVISNWAGNCFKLVDVGFTHNEASDTQNFKALLMETTIWTHMIFPLYFSNEFGEWLLPEVKRTTKYLRPQALVDKTLDQIDDATRAEQPFFSLLFFSMTHLPYTASYPYNVRYTDPAYRGAHRYQIDVTVHDLITSGFDPDLSPETIQHIRDLYDGSVAEFDHYVGQVIAALKARGLYERTIIIVTTDHGEDLYDAGSTLGHGTNFFGGDQSTRIPFFIRVPGVTPAGGKHPHLVRNIDLAPTLLTQLGGERPATWQGVDVSSALRGEPDDHDLPAFGETCYLFFPKSKALVDLTEAERADVIDTSSARETLEIDYDFNNNMVLRADLHNTVIDTKDVMVRTRKWKLIEIPGRSKPIQRLYDMQADPHQTKNLADQGLPVLPKLSKMLEKYREGKVESLRWPAAWE